MKIFLTNFQVQFLNKKVNTHRKRERCKQRLKLPAKKSLKIHLRQDDLYCSFKSTFHSLHQPYPSSSYSKIGLDVRDLFRFTFPKKCLIIQGNLSECSCIVELCIQILPI